MLLPAPTEEASARSRQSGRGCDCTYEASHHGSTLAGPLSPRLRRPGPRHGPAQTVSTPEAGLDLALALLVGLGEEGSLENPSAIEMIRAAAL
jgi:hypothetical protein